jgi:hypothetical protein
MGVTRRVLLGTERDALAFAFEHKCAGCRKLLQPGWHADHILALADGGPDEPQNMQPLCAPCHTLKTAHDAALEKQLSTWHLTGPAAPSVLIGLMGLPSAGKSSMVNALLGSVPHDEGHLPRRHRRALEGARSDTTKARSPVNVEHCEIADPEEETTVTDCLARVERMFPDTRICKFNAFGRIAHRAGSSEALRGTFF